MSPRDRGALVDEVAVPIEAVVLGARAVTRAGTIGDADADGHEDFFRDLLQVWAAEMTDEKLRKEAQALLFGLK